MDEDFVPEDDVLSMLRNVPVIWTGLFIHEISILPGLGIIIFALYVTYLGGRLKDKRFNERTIQLPFSLRIVSFEATLFRVAFIFLFVYPYQGLMNFLNKNQSI